MLVLGFLVTALLAVAPEPAIPWRLLAALLTVLVGARPILTLVFQRGRAAVRHFEWAADGTWSIRGQSGVPGEARLHPATAAIGPWIILVWNRGPAGPTFRSYALIDAGNVSRSLFRALRGRLKLTHGP